ncbi:SpoIIE family protein phosphatase [Candidatus Formimonas warabiya]|nr:SpoIIE family protein phosphatase [Candidatus Formimonas warabiya]
MLKELMGINKDQKKDVGDLFDYSTLRVIILASLVIVLSAFLMGGISYMIAEKAIVKKIKSQDLVYIVQSAAAKIDGRIERAKETALILAQDPAILEWVKSGEKDTRMGDYAQEQITDIAQNYDYSNSFIVSSITNHYWAEGGKLIDTMKMSDPDDSWFFQTIQSKKPVSVQIDFNKERNDTFVFVDALMGDLNQPLAVTGVGVNFKDIVQEFQNYKFGEKSNLWLIDEQGDIYISEDTEHTEYNIESFLPLDISAKIIAPTEKRDFSPHVLEYQNRTGEIFDLIYLPLKSTDWKLVLQIPRKESLSIVDSVKLNMALAGLISIMVVVFIFYFISSRIANPYKRAVILSKELERKVNERTQELNEQNSRIMESIEYAKMIQESVLPPREELEKALGEYFTIWKPRDTVGGDFYWLRRGKKGFVFVIGDCTGHGVPGALMTMAVNGILNHIVDDICADNPGLILKEMNRLLKQTLNRNDTENFVEDGLDAGIIYKPWDGPVVFAGAKISLYVKKGEHLHVIKGSSKGIGYRSTDLEYEFLNYAIELEGSPVFYLATDGYMDQNGGEQDYSFGRKRFEEVIHGCDSASLAKQQEIFERTLAEYMAGERQRDDITVIAFKLTS